jgi:hypothetical protein
MNEDNTNLLFERYPRLYQGRFLGVDKSSMSWGFCCGDGWFDLIDQLSAAIEAECLRLMEAGTIEDKLPIASQVKEKSGLLRFHTSPFKSPSTIQELIQKACSDSEFICEECGEKKYRRIQNHLGT